MTPREQKLRDALEKYRLRIIDFVAESRLTGLQWASITNHINAQLDELAAILNEEVEESNGKESGE